MFRESLQLVKSGAIEIEKGGAGAGVCEKARETCWIAGFEIAAWLNAGE